MTALGVLVRFGVKKYDLAEDDDCSHYKKGYIFFDFHVFQPKRINKKEATLWGHGKRCNGGLVI